MTPHRALVVLLSLLVGSCGSSPGVPPPWPSSPERRALADVIAAEGVGDSAAALAALAEPSRGRSGAVVRRRALLALVRGQATEAAERCRFFLEQDRDGGVRQLAAWGLGRLEPQAASVAALERAAGSDRESAVRAAAVGSLGTVSEHRVEALLPWLDDPEPLVRRAAALALPATPPSVDPLLARLGAERDERVRWALTAALASVPECPAAAVARLETLVRDPNFLVASLALLGVSQCAVSPETWQRALDDDACFWLSRAIALRSLTVRPGRDAWALPLRRGLEARLERYSHGEAGAAEYPLLRLLADQALGRSSPAVLAAGTPGRTAPLQLELGSLLASLPSRALGLVGLRHPRAVIRFAGKGAVTLELFAVDAPQHVSAFAALARAGYYDGRVLASVDPALGVSLASPEARDAAPSLPLEVSPGPLLRGCLLAADAAGRPSSVPGAALIAHLPATALEGRVTCWGAVLLGMEIVDQLVPGDTIEGIDWDAW